VSIFRKKLEKDIAGRRLLRELIAIWRYEAFVAEVARAGREASAQIRARMEIEG
jgi:hypothetical protein